MISLYQQLEQERRKNAELHEENDELRAENSVLKKKLSEGKKKPVPLKTKAVVRHKYKTLNKDGLEFDLTVSVDHPDNKAIIDRVVRGSQANRDHPVDVSDAEKAARAMFTNLKNDRTRTLNGNKGKQLKCVRRRNRMIQKMNSRRKAFDSKHCKLNDHEKSKAKIMFTEKMEYISSDEDDVSTETTPDGMRTIRTVRVLPFESAELKGYKHSLDQTYRNDVTPESRQSHLTILRRDPSASQVSLRSCPPDAPHWAVISLGF